MPSWWPWSRPKKATPSDSAPRSTAAPAWQRLPVIQRTVGGIEPTLRLNEFTSSLTTAQNPGLTEPMKVHSGEHPDRLPVLEVVRESVGAAVQRITSPPMPTPQPRTWSRRPPVGRSAHLGASPVAQRAVNHDVTVRKVHAIESASSVESASDSLATQSFVEAAQPADDHRTLEVVPDAPDGLAPSVTDDPVPPVAGRPVAAIADEPPTPVTGDSAISHDGAVSGDAPSRVASAVEIGSASPLTAGSDHRGQPARPVAPVQRVSTAGESTPRVTDAAHVTPVMRQADSSQSTPVRQHDEKVAPRPEALGPTLQRSHTSSQPADPASKSATETPPSAPDSHEQLPLVPLLETRRSATTSPPATVQRIAESAEPPRSAVQPERNPLPESRESSPPQPPLQRLHTPEAPRAATVAAGLPQQPSHKLPTVQRSPSVAAPQHLSHDGASPGLSTGPASYPEQSQVSITSVPVNLAPQVPAASVVQRLELPTQRKPVSGPGVSPATPISSAPLAPTVLQRSAPTARLVVLPPVRSSGTPTLHGVADTPATPARSVIFESPRPMSLQRMFEHTARQIETPMDASNETAAPPNQQAANTITFAPASIQREVENETASPPTEPTAVAAPSAGATTASPGASAPGGGDVEELVNRIYDPLAARLRTELWLDRERAGVLMDLER